MAIPCIKYLWQYTNQFLHKGYLRSVRWSGEVQSLSMQITSLLLCTLCCLPVLFTMHICVCRFSNWSQPVSNFECVKSCEKNIFCLWIILSHINKCPQSRAPLGPVLIQVCWSQWLEYATQSLKLFNLYHCIFFQGNCCSFSTCIRISPYSAMSYNKL